MRTLLRGVIHGKIIELPEETGFPEGQEVTVLLEPVGSALPSGEGLMRSAGAWAEDGNDLEEYLEWNRQQRKVSRQDIES